MAEKYIALSEEQSGYGTYTQLNDRICLKILNESIHTTREDHFPETAEYWTPSDYVRGPFRAGGDISILVDPKQFPKLLVLHLGDPSTTTLLADTVYQHVFTYGGTESVSTTGIKSFTIIKGTGVEKDRQFNGGIITNLTVEARAREPVAATVSVVGNGDELLITASSANYVAYSGQRYMTFADANTMTIGGTDRLTTAPVIESFTIELPRGYDTDHYRLGSPYMADQSLHGVAVPTGTMDFGFKSQDEHERFLGAVGATETGPQSGHIMVLTLRGDLISSGYYNQITFSIPETYYTASENAVNARDRIVDVVSYRGNYHLLSGHAVQITVINTTSSYTALNNSL